MTKEEAIYILRNTAFLAPSLEPIDEAIEMACEALKQADTPQTDKDKVVCPNCGRSDYIRSFEKDFNIMNSEYRYKCINCNTYIKTEPTISKMEQVDKDINVRSKNERQTERSSE